MSKLPRHLSCWLGVLGRTHDGTWDEEDNNMTERLSPPLNIDASLLPERTNG
jgi:hypothetical protein